MTKRGGTASTNSASGYQRRARLGWILSGVMCSVYFGFLALGVHAQTLLMMPLRTGGTVNLAAALSFGVIVTAVVLTGFYVWRANSLIVLGLLTAGMSWQPAPAMAQAAVPAAGSNGAAIGMFLAIIATTLVITFFAARRTRSARDFYTAGGSITGLQNGLAIAGDYMSAAAFLGLTALIYATGFDGLVYAMGFLVGWPIITFLVAERLRNLGRFTFADVLAARLDPRPMRMFAAAGGLTVIAFYLIAQMVGAGQLIRLLFGIDYHVAVIVVGILMIVYVVIGGMMATTWVQITKAILLLGGSALMALMVLSRFGYDLGDLMAEAAAAHRRGAAILVPQALVQSPISAVSLGLGLMLGTAGLPHILMRFFTVADAATARKSVAWATLLIGLFFGIVFVLGFGGIVLVSKNPEFLDAKGAILGGGNMVAIHLAKALGGEAMMGAISAIAFATILAVVAGLAISGAASISHDLYANVFRRQATSEAAEIRVSRFATVAIGVAAILLGLLFEKQNVAYMVGLAFAIAASANFPVLMLAMYWDGLTTRGALAGGIVGLVSSVALTIAGPAIWVVVIGNSAPLFPYDPPTIVTMPLAFLTCWLVSMLDRSPRAALDRAAFTENERRMRADDTLGTAPVYPH
ncbi:cation/acetate symporter ActP [Bradyrhizobium sp. 14AA]